MDAQEALKEALSYYSLGGMASNDEGTAMIPVEQGILEVLASLGFALTPIDK